MIGNILEWMANVYAVLFIARWLIEMLFVQQTNSGWFLTLRDVTNPLLEAVRKAVPPFNGIDFSYLICIVGVGILGRIINVIL